MFVLLSAQISATRQALLIPAVSLPTHFKESLDTAQTFANSWVATDQA